MTAQGLESAVGASGLGLIGQGYKRDVPRL